VLVKLTLYVLAALKTQVLDGCWLAHARDLLNDFLGLIKSNINVQSLQLLIILDHFL
jgi:hypothetical protein